MVSNQKTTILIVFDEFKKLNRNCNVEQEAAFVVNTGSECRSRDGSVAIATGYALEGPDSIPGRVKRFSLLHSV
jgi:hypothetical protein